MGWPASPLRSAAPEGAKRCTTTRIRIAMDAGTAASGLPAAATAPAAAQVMEEKASAKVAIRDEVWRRRKWLRFAWVRNHSWMAVAAAADAAIPRAAMNACASDA